MDWGKVLEANPLSVALLLCVILALVLWRILKTKPSAGDGSLLFRVERLEQDMERVRDGIEGLRDRVDERFHELLAAHERTAAQVQTLLHRLIKDIRGEDE